MKSILAILILLTSLLPLNAQMLCGTAGENGTITLTAPPGNTFVNIQFASYGTPNGSCGSFTIGACHSANSQAIVQGIFLGQNSASINATNTVFGDPCGGTVKRLYIQAIYSTTLPLRLISFTAQKTDGGNVRLDWVSENEISTSDFVIERSTDGVLFEAAGSVVAKGSGKNSYSFTSIVSGSTLATPTSFYRIKMIDLDGKYQYTNIVRINNNAAEAKLSVFPNPSASSITIINNSKQEGFITNNIGQRIKSISLINGNQTVNINRWPSGIYFIKTAEEVVKFIKK